MATYIYIYNIVKIIHNIPTVCGHLVAVAVWPACVIYAWHRPATQVLALSAKGLGRAAFIARL